MQAKANQADDNLSAGIRNGLKECGAGGAMRDPASAAGRAARLAAFFAGPGAGAPPHAWRGPRRARTIRTGGVKGHWVSGAVTKLRSKLGRKAEKLSVWKCDDAIAGAVLCR